MKIFYCKLCKEKEYMTRESLRKHLRIEHLKKRDLRCFTNDNRRDLQPWWGEEEWK